MSNSYLYRKATTVTAVLNTTTATAVVLIMNGYPVVQSDKHNIAKQKKISSCVVLHTVICT